MKTESAFHRILAIALLLVAGALLGVALAGRPTETSPIPIIVKNGPGPWFLDEPVTNEAFSGGELNFDRENLGATNLHLKAYFATVEVGSDNNLILSNYPATPATSYFTNDSLFNGDQSLVFGVDPNQINWATANFTFDKPEFTNTSRPNSLLLFLGKSGDFESAYIYSVKSGVTPTNRMSGPISTLTKKELKTNTDYFFKIHAPSGVSTNMDLRAYLMEVKVSDDGNFYLTNLATAQNALTTNDYLKDGTNYFDGTTAVPIVPGDVSEIKFGLKAGEFTANEQGPCLLVFLGASTNAGLKFEVAYSFVVRP